MRYDDEYLTKYGDEPLIGSGEKKIPEILKQNLAFPSLEGKDKYESYIIRMITLHPELKIGIPVEKLSSMSIETKKILIKDIQFGLGIYSE